MNSSAPGADGLPPLREVIRRHGLSARKGLGQNFLLDLNLTRRIARGGGTLVGVTVIEVGPGPGGLTRALLSEGAEQVIAIERDPRCLPALEEIAAHYAGRLTIIHDDALEVDVAALGSAPLRIIANLPYNIATALVLRWLAVPSWPPPWQSMTLMFQREVAQRLCARPGGRTFGRLSVAAQWRATPRILFDIDPRAFTPPPSVTSSLVHIVPHPTTPPCSPDAIEAITRAAFGQRRKMLKTSLQTLGCDVPALIRAASLAGTERPEQLDVDRFVRLAVLYDAARLEQVRR